MDTNLFQAFPTRSRVLSSREHAAPAAALAAAAWAAHSLAGWQPSHCPSPTLPGPDSESGCDSATPSRRKPCTASGTQCATRHPPAGPASGPRRRLGSRHGGMILRIPAARPGQFNLNAGSQCQCAAAAAALHCQHEICAAFNCHESRFRPSNASPSLSARPCGSLSSSGTLRYYDIIVFL